MRILVILFLVFIIGSLGSSLYYLYKDRGGSHRVVKALTVRVGLSIFLFVILMVSYRLGLITGHL